MKIKILGAKFNSKKMHIYDVKTKGKHPVHLIEYGEFLTENEMPEEYYNSRSDMGWFWLNQKEYNYFKDQCEEIEIEL